LASFGAPSTRKSKASGPFDFTLATIVPWASVWRAIWSALLSSVPLSSTAGFPSGSAFQVNDESSPIVRVTAFFPSVEPASRLSPASSDHPELAGEEDLLAGASASAGF
jgi:hypothetical protein